jgi:squalene-hopene/tetraprenyl-beta-curcumene cyclase
MAKGLRWLEAKQRPNGSWSNESYPALTAFGLWTFALSDAPGRDAVCEKAARFVTGFAQDDGGIYKPALLGVLGGGLSTYNTAVCMAALNAHDPAAHAYIILRAREFMASSQLKGDSEESGGFGYNRRSHGPMSRPDLSNTAWALLAMRETQGLEDLRRAGARRADLDWAQALRYVRKLQNQDEQDAVNYGGFGYEKGGERGGTAVNRQGAVTLQGYGSMTYAGLEAMIFAQLDRDDPRVTSALHWASRHWSVDENPGRGSRGLFYYYTIMAKALSLVSAGAIPRETGGAIPWRRELLEKLVAVQRPDGSWVNDDNTFWEGDPALVTAYSLMAMQRALGVRAGARAGNQPVPAERRDEKKPIGR